MLRQYRENSRQVATVLTLSKSLRECTSSKTVIVSRQMSELGALLCHLARCRAAEYDISAVPPSLYTKAQATGSDDRFQPAQRRVAKAPKGSERGEGLYLWAKGNASDGVAVEPARLIRAESVEFDANVSYSHPEQRPKGKHWPGQGA